MRTENEHHELHTGISYFMTLLVEHDREKSVAEWQMPSSRSQPVGSRRSLSTANGCKTTTPNDTGHTKSVRMDVIARLR
jgi:hypothetical protein